MNILRMLRPVLLLSVSSAVLSACAGGNGSVGSSVDPFVAGTDVLTSATTTSTAVLPFALSVTSVGNDSAEPVSVGDTTLATSETDEPDSSV